jgi:hypothetical protein
VFLTTLATFVERYSLWKAQNETKFNTFEQYQANPSLANKLKMIIPLRALHWTSFALVFAWGWYYLCAQAITREYTFELSAPHHHSRIFFQSTEAASIYQDTTTLTESAIASANAQFDSKFDSNTIQASDLYGGAIIPLMNQTADSGFSEPDEGGWRTIPTSYWAMKSAAASVVFSSSTGLPVYWANEDQAGPPWVGTYNINASYIFANCSDIAEEDVTSFPSEVLPTIMTSYNISSDLENGFAMMDVWNRVSNSSAVSQCYLSTHYVELQSSCDNKACAVQRMRPTPGKAFPSPSTPFTTTEFAAEFFDELMLSDGIPAAQTLIDGVAEFKSGLTYSGGSWTALDGGTNLGESLSKSITQLINTYMAATQPQDSILDLDPDFMVGLINGTIHNTTWPTGPAFGAMYKPGYSLAMPWALVDLITCTILLLAAIASFWLRLRTESPDVFRYRSSISVGKTEIVSPQGAHGPGRARALRGSKVKSVDLGPGVPRGGVPAVDQRPVTMPPSVGKYAR